MLVTFQGSNLNTILKEQKRYHLVKPRKSSPSVDEPTKVDEPSVA